MTLTDQEVLELNELCGAVVDGTLTEAQRGRLAMRLRESEAARQYYVRALGQSASLHGYASELYAEAPDARATPGGFSRFRGWGLVVLPVAAAVAVGLFLAYRPAESPTTASRGGQFVARLTAAKDAQWKSRTGALPPGTPLRRGQRLELSGGYAEITFDSGARMILEGAGTLDINSAWDATLRQGTLKANVPPEATGFRVSNALVDVVDLGTEFTMIADGKGAAEVLVLKGEVEASPRAGPGQETILLRENEARRFAKTGVSDVADSEKKFALFNRPLSLNRFSPTINYVHWSFDEAEGDTVSADVAGASGVTAGSVQLKLGDVTDLPARRTSSPHQRALHFDGQMYARANFPGISSSSPRTVAFWVRIPEDAQPLDTWMVSWATQLPKLGSRPVQISWNRRPGEGALGALRTDFGGGWAIGTTSLRDGRWHHVTVYFAAGDDEDSPIQVKQYIDGRLESSRIITDVVGAPARTGDATRTDVVWLGYRLTGNKQEGRRFRGELDELFIADRGLEPNEIVALMRDNRPPSLAVAANP